MSQTTLKYGNTKKRTYHNGYQRYIFKSKTSDLFQKYKQFY